MKWLISALLALWPVAAWAQGGGFVYPPNVLSPSVLATPNTWIAPQTFQGTCSQFAGSPGAADNTAALNAFLATISTNQQYCLSFAAGTYTFLSNNIPINLPAGATLTFLGQGQSQTRLYWPNSGGGLVLTYTAGNIWTGNGLRIQGVGFISGNAGGGDAIIINGNGIVGAPMKASTLSDVAFIGSSSSNYWNIGAQFNNVQDAYVDLCRYDGANANFATGIGVQYNTTVSGGGTNLTVTKCKFEFAGIGVDAEGYFQGVQVYQSAFQRVGVGLLCNAAIAEPLCSLDGGNVEAETAAVQWNNINNSYVNGVNIAVGEVSSGNFVGVQVTGTSNGNTITNDQFVCTTGGAGTNTAGIHYETGAGYNVSSGNNFGGCSPAHLYDSGSSDNLEIANIYQGSITPYTDNGTTNDEVIAQIGGLVKFSASQTGGVLAVGQLLTGGASAVAWQTRSQLQSSANGTIKAFANNGSTPSDFWGGNFYSGGTQGLSCSGSPTASFATVGGIVTHC